MWRQAFHYSRSNFSKHTALAAFFSWIYINDSGFPLNVLKRIATNHLSGTGRRKSSLQAQRPRVRIDPNEAIARFVRKKVFVSSRLKKSFLTAHRAIDKISQLKSFFVSQVFTQVGNLSNANASKNTYLQSQQKCSKVKLFFLFPCQPYLEVMGKWHWVSGLLGPVDAFSLARLCFQDLVFLYLT